MAHDNLVQLQQEFWEGEWPPNKKFIKKMKDALENSVESCDKINVREIIRCSEFAHKLIYAVEDALGVIERFTKDMNDDNYMCLIDAMHTLAIVGERNSHLYKEMAQMCQRVMRKMNYHSY